MTLREIERKRESYDLELDGFFNFVEVECIGNFRIVHRESKHLLGVIDECDNIIVPLIYDKFEYKDTYIETKIVVENDEYIGAISIETARTILPARYKSINLTVGREVFSCYDGKSWTVVSLENNAMSSELPKDSLPLENECFLCILRKCNTNTYKIECWNENENHTPRLLRQLARSSDTPGRIKLLNQKLSLIVYADIYGQVLFANKDLSQFFH